MNPIFEKYFENSEISHPWVYVNSFGSRYEKGGLFSSLNVQYEIQILNWL